MPLVIALFAAVAACIAGVWAWLGAPVAMPPSPLAAGQKIYCVSYAPFRGSQSPMVATTYVGAEQIDEDLTRLARITDCVRTYSADQGLEQVPAIAARHGLKVMQGLWLTGNPLKNRAQIDSVVALAKEHGDTIRAVIVGNEVLLRGEMSAPALADTIRQVKAAIPVPVTYADVWEFWLRYREIETAVDFVTIHILPYWEDMPVAAPDAGAHVDAIRSRVAASFPGKEVLIGEVGWPSAGRMREGALPSPANEARVLHDVLARAQAGAYRVNVIEAFDQPWKRALEGTVGGHWGLFPQAAAQPKFTWGEPVSNRPHWLAQGALGAALALAVFAAGWTARRQGDGTSAGTWIALAGIALAAGLPFGAVLDWMPTESLGFAGWLRSSTLALLSIAAPLAAAAVLTGGGNVPSFGRLLGGLPPPFAVPERIAGALLLGLCVLTSEVAMGLVFDPRYKDFPLAPLGGAVLAFAVLAAARGGAAGRGAAERLFAGLLAASAVYVSLNEGFANWQAQLAVLILLVLAGTLLWPAAGRSWR